jgi:ATP-binding cassette, subfamily C (CFTR/MRP), member 1
MVLGLTHTYAIKANATSILTPFMTFTFYVIVTHSNDQHGQPGVAQAFSSLTIIGLLTSSMSSAIQSTPKLLATRSLFKRIEDFIQLPRANPRLVSVSNSSHSGVDSNSHGLSQSAGIEMREPYPTQAGDNNHNAIIIQNGNFGYDANEAPILREINLQIEDGSVTMITGRIGCGKSTLLKAILGEMPLSTGRTQVKSSVAYCSQEPWLPNQSVLQTIVGTSELDEDWFVTVVQGCALTRDLQSFSHGRDTMVGTKGMNLSGGQRQRVVSSLISCEDDGLLTRERLWHARYIPETRYSC